jgi:hypothetical protein
MLKTIRSHTLSTVLRGAVPAALLLACSAAASAADPVPAAVPAVTYADVADLVEASKLVALVEVRNQAVVEPARAPGLKPGFARLYIEALTQGVLWGRGGLGGQVSFLADVPLQPNGKPPKLKKQRFIVFADPVANRADTLQLVAPDSYLAATPASEQLARTVIAALAAPGAPPRIKGVRDVMSVAGNLAGESETQLFVDTETGAPVSLTVLRRPGMEPQWGVSWSEIVDQAAAPPQRDTVGWYRLACFLPQRLPSNAFLQRDLSAQARAESDYRVILQQLGPCPRTRR